LQNRHCTYRPMREAISARGYSWHTARIERCNLRRMGKTASELSKQRSYSVSTTKRIASQRLRPSREATCLSAWRESIRVTFGSEHRASLPNAPLDRIAVANRHRAQLTRPQVTGQEGTLRPEGRPVVIRWAYTRRRSLYVLLRNRAGSSSLTVLVPGPKKPAISFHESSGHHSSGVQ